MTVPIIIFEDNHILVALKPQGLILGTAESNAGETFTGEVGEYLVKSKSPANETKAETVKEKKVFCTPVYLLDKPVGGLVVFAKSGKALNRLNEQIEAGDLERIFYAVTEKTPKNRTDRVAHFVRRDERTKKLEIVPQFVEGAEQAELNYSVIDSKGGFNLIKIPAAKDRPHHIRFQLAALKAPVYADAAYGRAQIGGALGLWLTDVRFKHPVNDKILTFRAFPPCEEVPWKAFNLPFLLKII